MNDLRSGNRTAFGLNFAEPELKIVHLIKGRHRPAREHGLKLSNRICPSPSGWRWARTSVSRLGILASEAFLIEHCRELDIQFFVQL